MAAAAAEPAAEQAGAVAAVPAAAAAPAAPAPAPPPPPPPPPPAPAGPAAGPAAGPPEGQEEERAAPEGKEQQPDAPAAAAPTGPTVAELAEQASLEGLQQRWAAYAAECGSRAIGAFNEKPKKGVALAIADGLCVEQPRSIAAFLLHAPGLDKTQIGEYVGNPAELNVATLREYVEAIGLPTFPQLGFDDALRMFLQGFRLPGEAAPIERCMEAFSDTFTAAQPDLFEKEDTAFLLAYSTIMLNTDLHNDAQKNKMSKKSFVERTQSTADDPKLSEAYLANIFERILSNEIQMNDAGGSSAVDLTSVAVYSKPRMQGYLTKKGHKMIRTSNQYWVVLKSGTLMLLDKPPALNAKPMLCLKMILPSVSVSLKGKSFEIVAPDGEAIIATRFSDRNEESEDVDIREYSSYEFEAESEMVASEWTAAILDEFGEPVEVDETTEEGVDIVRVVFRRMGLLGIKFAGQSRALVASVVAGSLAEQSGVIVPGSSLLRIGTVYVREMSTADTTRLLRRASANRPLTLDFVATTRVESTDGDSADTPNDGPTEQADDLRQDEMEEMIAESRLLVASGCLAAFEYENARLAYNAALQLSPHGPRAQEAARGLEQAEKGLKLERAATSIGPIVDNFRQSMAHEVDDCAADDAVLEVQQAMNSVLGVELSASVERGRLHYRCVRKAGVTSSLDYDAADPCMVAYFAKGEVAEVLDLQLSTSGKQRFLTTKGWCSMVSESGVVLFEKAAVGGSSSETPGGVEEALACAEETAAFHGELLEAMASQIRALKGENQQLREESRRVG